MSFVAKLVFSLTGPLTINEFEKACRHPHQAQESLLRQILERNKDTSFGRKHGFARIKTLPAYQKQVPVSTYEDLKPYIEAELRGKHGQLTAGKPVLFAMTSGTTGDAKYIPVTPESRKAKADLMKVWISAFYRDHPEIFSERVLSIVSPEMEERSPAGTPCGSESGHAYRNIPAPIRSLYALPYEVFQIEDYEARYYTILRITAAQSISLIVTVNPSTLLVLCERLAQHTRRLIHDIRHGGLSEHFNVPAEIREKIKTYLAPNPDRADELQRVAAPNGGKLSPRLIWPKLAAVACWQGGTVGGYLEKLKSYFPENIPFRDLGYLASEQRGSVPLFDDADSGVLAIATNVYEFWPAEKDPGERKPRRDQLLLAHEVELGKRYFVYVTTLGGLYRYEMNDIIEVSAYYKKTPMIRFIQKGKGMVSFTGEKLSEAQVLSAVEQAFQAVTGKYDFISAVGEMNGTEPRYIFLAEFDKVPSAAQLQELVRCLDGSLCEQNPEYASKRKSQRLAPPLLRIARRGEFDKFRKRKVNNGSPDGQFKILRLTDDANFAKEFAVLRDVELKGGGKRSAKAQATPKPSRSSRAKQPPSPARNVTPIGKSKIKNRSGSIAAPRRRSRR
jgi:hypothetical protein